MVVIIIKVFISFNTPQYAVKMGFLIRFKKTKFRIIISFFAL